MHLHMAMLKGMIELTSSSIAGWYNYEILILVVNLVQYYMTALEDSSVKSALELKH